MFILFAVALLVVQPSPPRLSAHATGQSGFALVDAAALAAQDSGSQTQRPPDLEAAMRAAMVEARELHEAGRYAEAIALAERSLVVVEKHVGPDHPATGLVLNNLSMSYKEKGDFAAALPRIKRAIVIFEKTLAKEFPPPYAAAVNNLGELYKAMGDLKNAEIALLRCLEIAEQAGFDEMGVARALNNISSLYSLKGEYARSEEFLLRALKLKERVIGPDDPSYLISLGSLGELHQLKGEYAKAEEIFQRVLASRRKIRGARHFEVAEMLGYLASVYEDQGDLARAQSFYKEAAAMLEETLGPQHPRVADALRSLAELHTSRGDLAEARRLAERALRIDEQVYGPEHPSVAGSLHALAVIHRETGDFAKAGEGLERALRIRKHWFGDEHPLISVTLSQYGLLFLQQGLFARAREMNLRALELDRKIYGPDSPRYATAQNNLAEVYRQEGDYLSAEPLYHGSLAIREKRLGPDHIDVANVVSNLALLHREKGDYEESVRLLRRAQAIMEKVLGPHHTDLAIVLNNLAAVYQSQDRFAEAEPLLRRALAIQEKALGPEHPAVAYSLTNLAGAVANLDRPRPEEAEQLLLRAVAIREKVFGGTHPDIIPTLVNIAEQARKRGDYRRSEEQLTRALGVARQSLPEKHSVLGTVYSNLALTQFFKGEAAQAIRTYAQAVGVNEYNLSLILNTGSEKQKYLYLDTLDGDTDISVSLNINLAPDSEEAARLALTTILQRKGRVLDAMTNQIGALRSRLGAQDRALLDQLLARRTELAAVLLRNFDRGQRPASAAAAQALRVEVERLEAEVSRRSAEFRSQSQSVTLESVQQQVPADAALVEVTRYRPLPPASQGPRGVAGAPRYAAYVLRRVGPPAFVDLGDAAAIERAVEQFRFALALPSSTDYVRAAQALEELVMRPVRKRLGDARHIIISPDSVLHLIPYAALVDEEGRFLVERHAISYLTSGRDLLRLEARAEGKQQPVVIANPAYDAEGAAEPAAAPRSEGAAAATQRSGDLGDTKWEPLMETGREASEIKSLLADAVVLTEKRATESALKRVAGPRILHVATHGFFLPDRLAPRAGAGVIDDRPSLASRENQLLRSGLVLTGGNVRRGGGGEDGILTALEASALDLWGTRLVVLSACMTGVGETRSGDGVYGLRRALALAGAESVLMSLWRVDDRATRELMVAYYRKLQAGEARGEALRQVQLQMLGSADRRHPYYWASFIPVGDWRRL